MADKVYQAIAAKVAAMADCLKSGNGEWHERHHDSIDAIVRDYMPSGSGFDSGTQFDAALHAGKAPCRKLTFETAFHHMNEAGYYDGWTHHSVIVTPSFSGFDIRVTGRNRNGIKEYIADCFAAALDSTVKGQ